MSKKKKSQPGRTEAPSEVTESVAATEAARSELAVSAHEDAPGAADAHGDDAVEAEDDKPQNAVIIGFIVATCLLLAVLVVVVREIFVTVFDGEINSKVLSVQSSDLRSLRAAEQQRLTHYQWVNQKDGVLRIPVDRAVELTLAAYRNPPPAPTPTDAQKPQDPSQAAGSEGPQEGKDSNGGDDKGAPSKDDKKGDAKDEKKGDAKDEAKDKKGDAKDKKGDAKDKKAPPKEVKAEEPKQ
jgi:hypothetical protein